ncbi:MAG: hypothetical protein CSB49_06320 [Proteobacteria bacterium]|nr:MAG: hypothetical protein CSB49_06320 [Pseudomonadota bacterium]
MVLRRSKPLALVCSLTLVGGLLLAQWHRATAVHSYCAEHGELSHTHGAEPANDHAQHHDPARATLHRRANPAHDEHGCAALDLLSHGSGVMAEDASLTLALHILDPRQTIREHLAFSGQRYRLCPKTSPPTA